jgi:uncharacterized repeat protein (TIGR03943 family)
VTPRTQGLLLAFVGAVLVRLAFTDQYLRYVTEWMKWPLSVTGALLLLGGVGPLFARRDGREGHAPGHDDHADGVPRVTWLLLLPCLLVFVVSPPPLGSFLAERRANDRVAPTPGLFAPLPRHGQVFLGVPEFTLRALDPRQTLTGRDIVLTGFVSYDEEGAWYVTRLSIGCCAADAIAYRVRVDGVADGPARDEWVRVTGRYVEGSGRSADGAAIDVHAVTVIPAPEQTYQ